MKMGKKITKSPKKLNNTKIDNGNENTADSSAASANNKKNNKKKHGKLLTVILICVVMVLAAAGFAVGYVIKSAHTAPPVEQTGTIYTGTGKSNTTAAKETGPEVDGADGYTRKDRFYNFLLLGRDQIGFNTDVFMIASFDVKNNSISIMQIPRDTYVEFNNGNYCKINSLLSRLYYAQYSSGAEDPEKEACNDLMELLQNNLNIKLDYYAMVDLDGFKSIVDRIGGVTLDVPADMYYNDPDQNLYINLKAGTQTLNGEQAEGFIRFRYGYTQADLGRIDAQKIFMSAFIKQVKEKISVSMIQGFISDALQYVDTSMPLSDCIYFANQVLKIDMSNINMMSAQGQATNYYGSYFVIYRDAMLMMVNKYFNVYTTDIPEQYFDVDRVFTMQNNNQINDIYTKEIESIDDCVKNAGNINDEGIYISRSY